VAGSPSLARRTVIILVLSQISAFAIGWIANTGLRIVGADRLVSRLDDLALPRMTKLIVASLTRDESGSIFISPVPELIEETNLNPRLRYAVFNKLGEPLRGSSPELVPYLKKVLSISSEHAHFVLPEDPSSPALGFMELRRTPFGRMHVAIYRPEFRLEDIWHSIAEDFKELSIYVVGAALMATGAAWVAVRHGLKPLRAIAVKAAQIDIDSLDQRLETKDVPVEISPLITAINEALIRVDAGVHRQRRFTANASHELRTPLAVMRAQLENARPTALNQDLLSQASALGAIVEQLLISARLSEGHVSMDQVIDLNATTTEIVENLLPLAIRRDRSIDLDLPTDTVRVRGNRRAIASVIVNLIDNALRAEPKGGVVIVRISDNANLEVMDHGAGIPESDRQQIFEPFWRKSELTEGTGLGLAIAKEIMDRHGGRILVEETLGGGATFKLSFPSSTEIAF
jgi:signal transduction histidine kinase